MFNRLALSRIAHAVSEIAGFQAEIAADKRAHNADGDRRSRIIVGYLKTGGFESVASVIQNCHVGSSGLLLSKTLQVSCFDLFEMFLQKINKVFLSGRLQTADIQNAQFDLLFCERLPDRQCAESAENCNQSQNCSCSHSPFFLVNEQSTLVNTLSHFFADKRRAQRNNQLRLIRSLDCCLGLLLQQCMQTVVLRAPADE
jgi:hypothetical protein